MLFNSFAFLVFFPIAFMLYWFVFNKRLATQNLLLLIASYIFYGWWSWKFLILLALSTLLDYLYGFGVALSHRKKAKMFLWLSIANNLGILGVLSITTFSQSNFKEVLRSSVYTSIRYFFSLQGKDGERFKFNVGPKYFGTEIFLEKGDILIFEQEVKSEKTIWFYCPKVLIGEQITRIDDVLGFTQYGALSEMLQDGLIASVTI